MSLFSKSHYHSSQDILFHGIITGRIVQLLPQRALQWLQEATFTWPRKSDLAEKSPPLITLYRQCLYEIPAASEMLCVQTSSTLFSQQTTEPCHHIFKLKKMSLNVCHLRSRLRRWCWLGVCWRSSACEVCSVAGLRLSMGLGTPGPGRSGSAVGPGRGMPHAENRRRHRDKRAGRGGAGPGCQVKPDTAGPRHGVDRIVTRPGGTTLPPLWGECHWCRLTQPPAAPGALQALEFPEWAKELIFTWDSFITLLLSLHPATEQNITISSCSELEMVKLFKIRPAPSHRHSPLTKCYRLDLYGSNICRSRIIFDSISKTLTFPSRSLVFSHGICITLNTPLWHADHPSHTLRLNLNVTPFPMPNLVHVRKGQVEKWKQGM